MTGGGVNGAGRERVERESVNSLCLFQFQAGMLRADPPPGGRLQALCPWSCKGLKRQHSGLVWHQVGSAESG